MSASPRDRDSSLLLPCRLLSSLVPKASQLARRAKSPQKSSISSSSSASLVLKQRISSNPYDSVTYAANGVEPHTRYPSSGNLLLSTQQDQSLSRSHFGLSTQSGPCCLVFFHLWPLRSRYLRTSIAIHWTWRRNFCARISSFVESSALTYRIIETFRTSYGCQISSPLLTSNIFPFPTRTHPTLEPRRPSICL